MSKLGYSFFLSGVLACGGSAVRPPGVDNGTGVVTGGNAGSVPAPDGAAGSGGSVGPVVGVGAGGGMDASGTTPDPTAGTPGAPHPSPRSVALYDESRVIDLELRFPPGQWDILLNRDRVDDDSRWARCSLTFEGETFADARCRRKGSSEHWSRERKPQMIVRFNFDDKMARFRGLRRLNLEFFYQTDAPIRDRLGMWAMREAGLDAPRVNHARVFKDGQLLGLYQNVEVLDKEFLEDHFGKESEGNLWESGEELKTNESAPDESRLELLNAWVDATPRDGDHADFFKALDILADVDQILLELAAETAVLTDDNFSNGAANYYYYDHPSRGFMVLPWDLDTICDADPDSDLFAFWDPRPNRMRELINQNAVWRARFVEKLIDIRDRVLTRLPARTDMVCAQIRSYVSEDPSKRASLEDFDAECDWFKNRVPQRIAEIRRILGR
jgi:hypothetical protein